MREAAFVKQNYDRWKKFEAMLQEGENAPPDQLADLFIQITDDLSFSRTQYPESDTTYYLNNLASNVHLKIYRNKKEDRKRFVTFWKTELPLLFASINKQLFIAFLVFVVAILMGIVSVLNDDSFVRLILGDAYVNMTLDNIKNGTPLGVYGQSNQMNMFFMITLNNVRVSFIVFAMGALLSVGTGFYLFKNGIMVGTFFTFLAKEGHLYDSLGVVMLHGTLELSAIVIAGAAGFVMGNSLLFPGTYPRLESFKRGAKKGLKIIVGLIPVFIVAGFIESFITRYEFMHWALKALIILPSAYFIIYYFIIYPIRLTKNNGPKN